MPTISEGQSSVTGDGGFLDLLIYNAQNKIPVLKLDNIVDALTYIGAEFVKKANENLNNSDRVASGFLGDSIKPLEIKVLGSLYTLEINVADYYKFIDKGVNGWQNSQGSPYKFQNYSGKSGKKESKMVDAIRKWVIQQHLQSRNTSKKSGHQISKREHKQSRITDASLSTAIAISRSVRKKGLKATHFWTDAETQVKDLALDKLSKSLKIDIVNYLSN